MLVIETWRRELIALVGDRGGIGSRGRRRTLAPQKQRLQALVHREMAQKLRSAINMLADVAL